MANLRTKGKSTIVWLLLGLLILGLAGFGVTNFGGSQTEIGRVGDTKVTTEDYARALQNQMNAYSQQAGQAFTLQQAQTIGLPQQVQAQLFTAAALSEATRKIGLSVGDQRVAGTIMAAPAFQGANGQFDRVAYGEILRREGLDEAAFEAEIRADEANLILQEAVVDGVPAPKPMVDQTVAWLLESRDITWRELTAEQLDEPVPTPDDSTLEAWHQANADRFTAPELRRITYLWLTPEMLSDEVELDEAALRAEYDRRKAEFQQPERRMVGRLVFPTTEAAAEAKARLDAGETPFEAVVIERGLALEDIDLGEVSQADLGAEAGAAVFALEQPGVVGPVSTDLGPALFSVNAILDPINVPYEEALPELRSEAALDRAARVIEDRAGAIEDLLASGATLEEVAKETEMELGQIDFNAAAAPEHEGIDGYQAFRERATVVEEGDFPQLYQLDDGGVFALRLDEIVPPTLRPLAEVKDEVQADWVASETRGMLLAMAENQVITAPEAAPPGDGPVGTSAEAAAAEAQTVQGLTRDGWIEGAPADLITRAFAMAEPGTTQVVEAEGRIFLVTLDAVHSADPAGETATDAAASVGQRITESLQSDLFNYYVRGMQAEQGIEINQAAIAAAQTLVQ